MEGTIFRKIMIATDGSEEVKKAVKTAVEIAKLTTSKLYAMHVISMGFYLWECRGTARRPLPQGRSEQGGDESTASHNSKYNCQTSKPLADGESANLNIVSKRI